MRIKGKITHWNPDKAFGFITPESGAKQVFVHIKAFADRSAALAAWLFTPGGAAFLQGLYS